MASGALDVVAALVLLDWCFAVRAQLGIAFDPDLIQIVFLLLDFFCPLFKHFARQRPVSGFLTCEAEVSLALTLHADCSTCVGLAGFIASFTRTPHGIR